MSDYETRERKYNLAYVFCGVSALIFFTGLIMVLLNMGDEITGIGTIIAVIGGILLLITYIVMKYMGHSIRINRSEF